MINNSNNPNSSHLSCHSTSIDFNSRLLFSCPSLQLKPQTTNLRNNLLKVSQPVSRISKSLPDCTKTIKIKIGNLIGKVQNKSRIIKDHDFEAICMNSKTKSLFKGNQKLNKSKKELQLLNKSKIQQSLTRSLSASKDKQNKVFIVREIKPLETKTQYFFSQKQRKSLPLNKNEQHYSKVRQSKSILFQNTKTNWPQSPQTDGKSSRYPESMAEKLQKVKVLQIYNCNVESLLEQIHSDKSHFHKNKWLANTFKNKRHTASKTRNKQEVLKPWQIQQDFLQQF